MVVRITWDRYEVALLFRAYEKVATGSDLTREAETLSQVLRDLAVRRGVAIDETYRNVNGMKPCIIHGAPFRLIARIADL